MKSFKNYHEGWFSKKEPEDEEEQELQDLGMKSSGRGSWSKRDQERYNDLWMKMHKKGKTPTMSPPSVHGDDSWATKPTKLHKKLRLTRKDHPSVLS